MDNSIWTITIVLLFVTMMQIIKVAIVEPFANSESMVPMSLVHNETINVNTRDKWVDVFVRDNFLRDYGFYVNPTAVQKPLKIFKCMNESCDPVNRIEYPAVRGNAPSVSGSEIVMDLEREIMLVEAFESEPAYHTIPMVVKIPGYMRLNERTKLKQFKNMAETEPGMQIFFHESEDVRRTYDLYACVWDDTKKTATCQKIAWQIGDVPEIDLGRNKAIDMIRIVPKAHNLTF